MLTDHKRITEPLGANAVASDGAAADNVGDNDHHGVHRDDNNAPAADNWRATSIAKASMSARMLAVACRRAAENAVF